MKPSSPDVAGLTCQAFVEFLEDYDSGELLPRERRAFEEHLRACEACTNYLATYTMAVKLGQATCRHPADPPPAGAPEHLIQAVLAALKRRH